jgi:hypothetical protein
MGDASRTVRLGSISYMNELLKKLGCEEQIENTPQSITIALCLLAEAILEIRERV